MSAALRLLELHVGGDAIDLTRVAAEFPTVAIRRVAAAGADPVTAAAWRDDALDFWAFDRRLDELAAHGAAIRLSSPAPLAAAIAGEVLTRAQRLGLRRTAATRTPWFDQVLELHRAQHDLAKPLVRADYDHALDAWQWAVRVDPDASAAIQLATLLHDIERLTSEADVRVEQHAADYQAFKDAHARRGARLAHRVLERAGVPAGVAADAAALIEVHERASEAAALRTVNDADGLSFFSLNSPGYLAYFGREQTARKIGYTLARMSATSRRLLAGVRLPGFVRAEIDRGHP